MRRAVAAGILETAPTTFLLLIALRWFQCGPTAKALLAGGGSIGLLLTPLAVYIIARLRVRSSRAAAQGLSLAALATALTAVFPSAQLFVLLSIIALACSNACVPFFTQIYHENYPDRLRGRLFARSYNVRILASVLFGAMAGFALDGRMAFFQILLAIYAICYTFSAWCMAQIPSTPLNQGRGESLAGGFRYVLEDPFFRNTLICWMLMGFGNLMMIPLRVEYLASSRYGLNLSAFQVALLVAVLPNMARMLMNPLWGKLFDRISVQHIRLAANLGFVVAILAFFFSSSLIGLCLGSIFYGVGSAGGDITWNLWITKCAPVNRAAACMSVHTCLTGLRGILAPLVAFHLLSGLSVSAVAWISAGLILLSNVFLFLPGSRPPGTLHTPSAAADPAPAP